MLQLAIDIGGTFTDFALRDSDGGGIRVWKVPTSSREPARAVIENLSSKMREGEPVLAAVGGIVHATTIATNAILERKGSRIALITTKGFRDVLLLGRQKRYDTNDLHLDKPRPLVERCDIFEVDERLGPDGAVLRALDEGSAAKAVDEIDSAGYQSAAVAFLHSYANPLHEQRMAKLLRARLPNLPVTLSSVVSPKFREYERTSTTVANAYVAPLVGSYISALEASLQRLGINCEMSIMQSNGGLVSSELARLSPVRIIESGPAAGVLMCAEIGRQEGYRNVMTFDMGGTTAKLGAINDGVPAVSQTFEVDTVNCKKGSGLPLNMTAVELLEIGAGGGSIARASMGLIVVGPDSAGAEPGPACYQRGGTDATVTDANLVLGYLNPEYFNGGAMRLDANAAKSAVADAVAEPLHLSVQEAAWGIHSVANANMERAMRVVSIERGRDPRHYAMVAFGGAGPLHACRLARALGIPRVIVPFGAGVGSALGLLVAEPKVDAGVTRVVRLDGGARQNVADLFEKLEAQVMRDASGMRYDGVIRVQRSAWMRHVGQGYEIRVDLPDGPVNDQYEAAALAEFHTAYKREYGYNDPGTPVEATDWYVTATVVGSRLNATLRLDRGEAEGNPIAGKRAAYFPESGGLIRVPVIHRHAMSGGDEFAGPALIEERESTTVVTPGDHVSLSSVGDLVIEIGGTR